MTSAYKIAMNVSWPLKGVEYAVIVFVGIIEGNATRFHVGCFGDCFFVFLVLIDSRGSHE